MVCTATSVIFDMTMQRGLVAIALGIVCLLTQQTMCSWFNQRTVMCNVGGVCVPDIMCPAPPLMPSIRDLVSMYAGYARVYWVTTASAGPVFASIEAELAKLPVHVARVPLLATLQLQADGAEVGAVAARLMRSIEGNLTVPLHIVAQTIMTESLALMAPNASAVPAEALWTSALGECAALSAVVRSHIVQTTDLGLRLDTLVADARVYETKMQTTWMPAFRYYPAKYVSPNVKAAGLVSVAAVAGKIVALAHPWAPALAAATSLMMSFVCMETVQSFEQQWADDAKVVQTAAGVLAPYVGMLSMAIGSIETATAELQAIEADLEALQRTVVGTLAVPEPGDDVHTWATSFYALGVQINTEIADVTRGVAVERRQLHLQNGGATF
jgi:hypothetical protein